MPFKVMHNLAKNAMHPSNNEIILLHM